MKIIVFNRDNKHSHFGGDLIQAQGYVDALKKLGHDTTYSYEMFNLHTGDQHWVFHLNFGWAWNQYTSLTNQKKDYIMIPIFYPQVIDNEIPKMRAMLRDAKKVFCLSNVEKEEMIKFLELEHDIITKIETINNGVDKEIFNVYGDTAGVDCIMSAGRFDNLKQFELVIKAAEKLNKPVTIVGAQWGNNEYRERLKGMYSKCTILEGLSQEELAKHYRSARVFVSASDSERNSLVVLEALACGARVISGPGNRGNEWLPGIRIQDPVDTDGLAKAIDIEWKLNRQRYDFEIPSWEDVVKTILSKI